MYISKNNAGNMKRAMALILAFALCTCDGASLICAAAEMAGTSEAEMTEAYMSEESGISEASETVNTVSETVEEGAGEEKPEDTGHDTATTEEAESLPETQTTEETEGTGTQESQTLTQEHETETGELLSEDKTAPTESSEEGTSGNESVVESETETETETETESETETETETETESETETETETETEIKTEKKEYNREDFVYNGNDFGVLFDWYMDNRENVDTEQIEEVIPILESYMAAFKDLSKGKDIAGRFQGDVLKSIKSHYEDYNAFLENAGLTLTYVNPHMSVIMVTREGSAIAISASERLRTSCTDGIESYEYDEIYNITIKIKAGISEKLKISGFESNTKAGSGNEYDDEEDEEEAEEIANPEFDYVKSSKIKPLPLLGNNIKNNVVKIAQSQLGFIEGTNNDNAFAHSVNAANNQKWCMTFVTWCAYNAGIDKSKWPDGVRFNSSARTAEWFYTKGRYYSKCDINWYSPHGVGVSAPLDSKYEPVPGDVVVFDTDGNLKNGPDHAGIYIKKDSQYYYTIEGNTGKPNGVYWRKYNISNLRRADHASIRIMGFCNPDYSGRASATGQYYDAGYESVQIPEKEDGYNQENMIGMTPAKASAKQESDLTDRDIPGLSTGMGISFAGISDALYPQAAADGTDTSARQEISVTSGEKQNETFMFGVSEYLSLRRHRWFIPDLLMMHLAGN